MTIFADINQMEPGALVELFVLDTTNLGGQVYYLHNGTNQLQQPVVWQGNTYQPFPIQAQGFEFSGKGTLPRPIISVANVSGILGALVRSYDDLIGCKFIRKRTLAKYLDAVNFAGGVNPSADPNAAMPDDVFYIDRKASENKVAIQFELSAAFDVAGVQLPRRVIVQNICTWRYRGAECGYTGGYVDANDAATTDPAADFCSKRLTSCKARFGATSPLPYGGFPGAGLL